MRWEAGLLLACRASTHKATVMTPYGMVFGRELCLPCDLLSCPLPTWKQSTTEHVVDVVDWLHDIHHPAHQVLKVTSDRMSAYYIHMPSSMGFQEGDQEVWMCSPTWMRGKSPKLQQSWEGPCKTQISKMVYNMRPHPRLKMVWFVPYLGASWAGGMISFQNWAVSHVPWLALKFPFQQPLYPSESSWLAICATCIPHMIFQQFCQWS
jgi:hypothetical protein